VLECVANVSEGRDPEVLDRLRAACGASLLDVHVDPDHHRSVFTLAGPGTADAAPAVRALAGAVADLVDIRCHDGVHPRLGALDVVPFVALPPTPAAREEAASAARSFARWWSAAYEVPVFLYDDADPQGRDLPQARRTAFAGRAPDHGPDRPHPRLGATAVGARRPLVALNCVLATPRLDIARRVARSVRERDGGLAAVRALAFWLDRAQRAQVSLNLVDLDRTGVQEAVLAVRDRARREGSDVAAVELVGLLPAAELDRCSKDFAEWAGLDAAQTIEARLAARGATA
jgi:glutamate formiminotransferase